MSEYKNHLLRQLGIKESSIKPSSFPRTDANLAEIGEEVDPEFDEKDKEVFRKSRSASQAGEDVRQSLGMTDDYYDRLKKDGQSNKLPKFESMISPTAISPQVIAIGVRGSSTGGLPSGADRNMSAPQVDGINVNNLTRGQLGGYEAIAPDRVNSDIINKTPRNPQINSTNPITQNPQTTIDPHPHQVQRSQGEVPQNVTGASTDSDSTLKLKMAMPKGIDIDVAEEGEEGGKDGRGEPHAEEEKRNMNVNETFKRHIKLMKESFEKNTDECTDCGCGKANTTHDMKESNDNVYLPPKPEIKKPTPNPKPSEPKVNLKPTHLKQYTGGEEHGPGWHLKPKNGVSEVNHTTDSNGKTIIAVGAPGSQARWETENPGKCFKCKETTPCKCGKNKPESVDEIRDCSNMSDDKVPAWVRASRERSREIDKQRQSIQQADKKKVDGKDKEEVKEVYSAPFERMRGLANLGERRVSKGGIWENTKVGASEPFLTHWKMDKEKAGMVKVDEKKLETIKESLSKKKTLTLKETRLLELAKKLDEKKNS